MEPVKIFVAGMGSAFVAFATHGFLYLLFRKSHWFLAMAIGAVIGLALFKSVCRSIIKEEGDEERQNSRANRSES